MRVLIIGGTGYFGHLLVEDVLKFSNCTPIVASRRPTTSATYETVVADLGDSASLEAALAGVDVAICAAGPYQVMSTQLADICIHRRVHYIDLADDRVFVNRVHALVANNETLPAICSGWSTVSALSGALAQIAAAGQERVDSIQIQMAPGNRGARHRATMESLLHSVGTSFTICRNRRWETVHGWSEPRSFVFPSPIGTRVGYLVNVPDLELFPRLFRSATVEFRAGSELMILNAATSGLAWLVKRRFVKDWTAFSALLQRAAAAFSFAGHDWGAVGVEVRGSSFTRRVSVVADNEGQRIAVMPASIMTSMLMARPDLHGLISPADWIAEEQLRLECSKRGFRLIVEEV